MGFKISAAAVMVGFLVTGCATSTMPGTIGVGRPQLLMVPSATINAAAATQYLQMSAQATQAGRLNADPVLSARVKGIANRLIQEVGVYRPEASTWNWEVNVFDKDEINAFCAPGGKIGVYSGIVRQLELSDDELAAVLGHEIAHALREHSREKASQGQLSQAIVQAIANSNTRYAGAKAQLADLGSLLVVRLPFSRQMESEADLMGLELMARAGYNPRAAANVWRKMAIKAGGSSTDFFSTHPANERRVEEVEAAAPRVVGLYERAAGVTTSAVALAAPPTPAGKVPSTLQSVQAGRASTGSPLSAQAGKSKPVDIGTHEYQVLALARERSCLVPQVSFLERGPGFESYALTCGTEPTVGVSCQLGNCHVK
jgi:predicted Zn-dependent protease